MVFNNISIQIKDVEEKRKGKSAGNFLERKKGKKVGVRSYRGVTSVTTPTATVRPMSLTAKRPS